MNKLNVQPYDVVVYKSKNVALFLAPDSVVYFHNPENSKVCGRPYSMQRYHMQNIKHNLGNIHTLVEQINAGSYRK